MAKVPLKFLSYC